MHPTSWLFFPSVIHFPSYPERFLSLVLCASSWRFHYRSFLADCFLTAAASSSAWAAFLTASTASFFATISSFLSGLSSVFPDAACFSVGLSSFLADSPSFFACAFCFALTSAFFLISASFRASSAGLENGLDGFPGSTPTWAKIFSAFLIAIETSVALSPCREYESHNSFVAACSAGETFSAPSTSSMVFLAFFNRAQ